MVDPVPPQRTRRTKGCPDERTIRLLAAHAPSPQTRAAVLLLSDAGCRLTEALSFDPRSLGERTLRIWGAKTKRWRTVPLTARLQAALVAVTDPLSGGETGPVLSLTPRSVQRLLIDLSARLSLPRTTPHRLRHSYATRLWQAGVQLHTIALLMGHSNPATSLIYVHAPNADPFVVAAAGLNRLAGDIDHADPGAAEQT